MSDKSIPETLFYLIDNMEKHRRKELEALRRSAKQASRVGPLGSELRQSLDRIELKHDPMPIRTFGRGGRELDEMFGDEWDD